MDSKRKVDPFVMPEGASVFNNSYLSKKLASQLLMQNIIIPKLNELNVSTSKYKCDEDEKKDASSSSKVISQKKVNVKKKITNIKNNSQQPVVIGKNIVKNSNVYLKKEAKDDSNSSTLVKVVLPTSLKDNK
jgi:hypothetical protein